MYMYVLLWNILSKLLPPYTSPQESNSSFLIMIRDNCTPFETPLQLFFLNNQSYLITFFNLFLIGVACAFFLSQVSCAAAIDAIKAKSTFVLFLHSPAATFQFFIIFVVFCREKCIKFIRKWHVNYSYGAFLSDFVKRIYNLTLMAVCMFKRIMQEEEGERGRPEVNEDDQPCQGPCDIEKCPCARAQCLRMRAEISHKRREIESMKWRCATYQLNRWKLFWHGNVCSHDARTLAMIDTNSSDESQARGARYLAGVNAGRWGCGCGDTSDRS